MTADVTRRTWTKHEVAHSACARDQSAHKKLEAARELIAENVHAFDNQPAAWNPQQHIERCRLFLATS